MKAKGHGPSRCQARSANVTPNPTCGLLVLLMNGSYFHPDGYEKVSRQMQDKGLWLIRKFEKFNCMTGLVRSGWVRVTGRH